MICVHVEVFMWILDLLSIQLFTLCVIVNFKDFINDASGQRAN